MQSDESSLLLQRIMDKPFDQIVKACHVVHLPPKDGKGNRFIVNLLNESYSVDVDRGEVMELLSSKVADSKLSRLILKYLAGFESMQRPSEGWLSLDKFKSGQNHASELVRRASRPLMDVFGYDAAGFENSCKSLGGKREKLGGISYSFNFFPKFKMLVQLWVGDEKSYKGPESNFMFSSTAKDVFNGRDLVDAAEFLVSTLIRGKYKRGALY